MKHDRLVKELEKLGLQTEKQSYHPSAYFAVGEKYIVEWYKEEEHASCVHIMRNTDERNSQRDHFPGFFIETYKSLKVYL